jgi:hypothetical protein
MPIVQLMDSNLENVTLHSKYIESIMIEIKYLKLIISKIMPNIDLKNDNSKEETNKI